MKASIATFYSHKDTRRVLKWNTTVLCSTVHSTKKPQTLNVKTKSSKSHETKKYVARPRVFSTRNISTDFGTPIQNFTRKGRRTIWTYQPNTSQQCTYSLMHLCKLAHNVTLQSGQWQQIIPKPCWWNWLPKILSNDKLGSMKLIQPTLHPLQFIFSI